jgi:hypothetical protein
MEQVVEAPPKEYSHLTLTGFHAGRPLCDGVKSPNVNHYHAAYAPNFVFADPNTCPACLRLWNSADEDE